MRCAARQTARLYHPFRAKGRSLYTSHGAPGKSEGGDSPFHNPWEWKRVFRGPAEAVVLDFSGTTCDNWVIAPAVAFVETFREFDVPITMEEARLPMGLRKDLHLKALLEDGSILQRWRQKYHGSPTENDLKKMVERFNRIQLECLPEYATLIPGTAQTVDVLRQRYGLKIGASTGFARPMVDVLLAAAKEQGFVPDATVAGDEVTHPRPYPYMVFQNMAKMGILNTHAVIKVDDTISGVQEGLNAGCWSVGLFETSNYMNVNEIDHGLSIQEFRQRANKSREILLKSGAHYVVPNISYLPAIVARINGRLSRGETPA